jgi:hypothetical protein
MMLKLTYPPTPEFAAKHAEVAVVAVKDVDNVVLDYSPQSLGVIDRIIQNFRAQGSTENDVKETIFCFGCYAGEVLVRATQGSWCESKDVMSADMAKLFPFMVVQLPNGKVWSPITKAFKQLANGSEDSLEYFYQVATDV